MNLERTFRAAVGLMRWRIKFMVIGLGMLFAVRAYTSSQTLLFHTIDLPLQFVDCGALFAACLLVSRSLLREGHFDLDVYPSHIRAAKFTDGFAGGNLSADHRGLCQNRHPVWRCTTPLP